MKVNSLLSVGKVYSTASDGLKPSDAVLSQVSYLYLPDFKKRYLMLIPNIKDETSQLKTVVIGTAKSLGGIPEIEAAYDPKSKENIRNGTYPAESDLVKELDDFVNVLSRYNVNVLRPELLDDLNQIYARDVGFVIEDKFIQSHMVPNREKEVHGITLLKGQINPDHIIEPPAEARIEGGDVMPCNGHIFIGYSKAEDFNNYIVSRTNEAGVEFIKKQFPGNIVKAFELNKSDDDPMQNTLHLDCCFQHIGLDQAILYKDGFKHVRDYQWLIDFFGPDKIIEITKQEMYQLFSNVFSISSDVIVSEKGFTRLNNGLRDRGFTVEEVGFSEIAKMSGLFRCATLPLIRENNQYSG